MDKKTLEYMKERVETGERLLKRIEDLKVKISCMQNITAIKFEDFRADTYILMDHRQATFGNELVKSTVNLFINLATKEIQRLEEEFARL